MFHSRLFFVVVLLLGIKTSLGEELTIQHHDGFGYELTQSKLESLESRFTEHFDQLKKQVEVIQQQLNGNVERKISQLEKGIDTSIGNKVSLISDQISNLPKNFSERYDQLEKQMGRVKEAQNQFNDKVSQMTDQILKLQYRLIDEVDCSELPKSTSGLCLMDIGGNKTMVYQVHRFDVDWLTVLQRSDGSVNFHRNWTDYRDGFGTAGKEFWLGLERLHVLTKNDSYELLFELEDYTGNYKYARYDKFSIGPEEDLYRLNTVGTYSGTAGDSFTGHKGYQFSALEKGPKTSCVIYYTGGWWYNNSCNNSHLTGKWQRTNSWSSIVWESFGSPSNAALKFARMLIRKI